MRYPGLLIAILPLLSPAYARAQSAAAKRAIVEGDVVNAVTGAPIAGVRVKLDPRQAEALYLKSDAAGHFVFRDVPPALYLWSVDAAGFLPPQSSFLDLTLPEKVRFVPRRAAPVLPPADSIHPPIATAQCTPGSPSH
jgi:hypothetical protein